MGWVLDATRMARASGVQMELDSALEWDESSLFGGEDHGLLACFPAGVDSRPDLSLSVLSRVRPHKHPSCWRAMTFSLRWAVGTPSVTTSQSKPPCRRIFVLPRLEPCRPRRAGTVSIAR